LVSGQHAEGPGYETEYPASNRQYFSFKPGAVFEKRRLPYASVSYGPLLFALPIPDKDPNTPVPDARWRFALDNDADRNGADVELERRPMPPKWDWPLESPLALKVPARTFDWSPTDAQPLPNAPVAGGKAETIRLIPYGCTRFRISMFPVTTKSWGSVAFIAGQGPAAKAPEGTERPRIPMNTP
jgi:hypothetical protein